LFLKLTGEEGLNTRDVTRLIQLLEAIILVSLLFWADNIDIPNNGLRERINTITYGAVAIFVLILWKKVFYVLTKDWSLTLLVLFAIASILWSVEPSATLEDLRGLGRTVLFGAYLAARFSPHEQRSLFTGVAILSLVLNVLIVVALPGFGIDPVTSGLWKGIYTFKQFFGRAMSFSISIFLVRLLDKDYNRYLSILGLALSILFLLLSGSKTNLIVLIVLTLLLPLYRVTRQRLSVRWAFGLFFIAVLTTTVGLVAANYEFIVTTLLGKNLQLNGRTPIWSMAITFLMQKPWLGYGYSAFWASEQGQLIIQHTWIRGILQTGVTLRKFHAHNTFLEIYLQLGIIGGTMLLLNVVLVLKRVYDLLVATRSLSVFWMLQFAVFQVIYNMAEIPTYLSPFNMYWVVYVAIAYSASLETSRMKRLRTESIPDLIPIMPVKMLS
jgi:exopolysaccharide production protein ExoQ